MYKEVKKRAFKRIKLLNKKDENELLENAIKIRVENRYRLVTLMQLRKDGKFNIDMGTGEYSQLLEYTYIRKLQKIAFELHDISDKICIKYLAKEIINAKNMKKFDDRFKDFFENIKRL